MAKITKTMAEEAACKMADKVYDEKISKVQDNMMAFADEVARKYIPSPVLACIKEYVTWFDGGVSHIGPYSISKDGVRVASKFISTNVLCPPNKYFEVSWEDYCKIDELRSSYNRLLKEKAEYETEVLAALRGLGTTTKVSSFFPEAVPYLNLPTKSENLPVSFKKIRDIFNASTT